MISRLSDFRKKEVINITDGKRLGFVDDIEIDIDTSSVDSIVIPGPWRFFRFWGRESEYIIPWERIKKIGQDIVLVEMDERFIRKYFEK